MVRFPFFLESESRACRRRRRFRIQTIGRIAEIVEHDLTADADMIANRKIQSEPQEKAHFYWGIADQAGRPHDCRNQSDLWVGTSK